MNTFSNENIDCAYAIVLECPDERSNLTLTVPSSRRKGEVGWNCTIAASMSDVGYCLMLLATSIPTHKHAS